MSDLGGMVFDQGTGVVGGFAFDQAKKAASKLIAGLVPEKKRLESKLNSAFDRAITAFEDARKHEYSNLDPRQKKDIQEWLRDQLSCPTHEALGLALMGPKIFSVSISEQRRDELGTEWSEGIHSYTVSFAAHIQPFIRDAISSKGIFEEASSGQLQNVASEFDALWSFVNGLVSADAVTQTTIQDILAELAQMKFLMDGTLKQRRYWSPNRPRVATHFQVRNEMEELTRTFGTNGVVSLCTFQGMRGVGKSQLAAKYAEQCEANSWMFVGWITASSKKKTIGEMAEIARSMNITDEKRNRRAANDLISWLHSHDKIDKLLVFDNVEDARDLDGLIPRGTKMQVLVTTTRKVTTLGTAIPVGVFNPLQAIDYLIKATGIDDRVGAGNIAKDLGHLPVALNQAAAVINSERLNYAEYRKLLDEYPLAKNVRKEEGENYPYKVDVALRLAYTTAITQIQDNKELDPRSGELSRITLWILCLLAEEGVPHIWFDSLDKDSPRAVRQAIGELIRRSVITESQDGSIVTLHWLQGQVIWEDLNDADLLVEASDTAVQMLGVLDLGDSNDFMERQHILTQIASQLTAIMTQSRSKLLLENKQLLEIVVDVINRSDTDQHPYVGIKLAGYLTHITNTFGPDHPNSLNMYNNLASVYRTTGDLTRSIELYEEALANAERSLDSGHHSMLALYNNLANAYRSAGQPSRAITLLQRALANAEQALGGKHPDVLTVRNNLANAYRVSGRFIEAIALYEQTLDDREQILGPKHSSTLTSRNNLAGAYESIGDLARAIPLYKQTLADSERLLGFQHPDTLNSRSNLGCAYVSAGDIAQALPLLHRTISDMEEILGANHPDTLTAYNNLACAYKLDGDLLKALALFEETLSTCRTVLGAGHPVFHLTETNLVDTRYKLEKQTRKSKRRIPSASQEPHYRWWQRLLGRQ